MQKRFGYTMCLTFLYIILLCLIKPSWVCIYLILDKWMKTVDAFTKMYINFTLWPYNMVIFHFRIYFLVEQIV